VSVNFSRSLSRQLRFSVGAGPQFTTGSGSIPIPSSTNIAVDASLSYSAERTTAVVSYQRGTNSGSGVVAGAFTDSVSLGVSRPLNRNWMASASASYSNNTSLTPASSYSFSSDTVLAAVQVSRRLGRSLSGYASYSAVNQSLGNSATLDPAYMQNAFSGLNNIVAVGVTFSPAAIHSGR
jgi:hypothetical protein